jgi:hypothetical protein
LLVLDEGRGKVGEHRLAMRGSSIELAASIAVTHLPISFTPTLRKSVFFRLRLVVGF